MPTSASNSTTSDEDLYEALRQADLAGDHAAAQQLSAYIYQRQANTTITPDGPQWGPEGALLNGLLLGKLPQISAAIGDPQHGLEVGQFQPQNLPFGLGALFTPPAPGQQVNQLAPSTGTPGYAARLAAENTARDKYRDMDPLTSNGLEIAGSLPATIGAAALTPELGIGRGIPLIGKTLARVAQGAIEGGESGALQSGFNTQGLGENTELGAGIGAVLPLTGALASRLNPLASKINPNVADMANSASGLGVDLRPGQLTPNRTLAGLDTRLASGANAAQLGDYTRAIGRTFGVDAPALTPQVMDKAKSDLQTEFNDIASKTKITYDRPLDQGLDSIYGMTAGLPPAARSQVFDTIANVRANIDAQGNITGDAYQKLTAKGSPIMNLARDENSSVRQAGGQIRDQLDQALSRYSSPADIDRLGSAREQWKRMQVLQPLVEKAQPSGVLDPQLVHAAVRKGFHDYGWTAPDDLDTLAESGKFLAKSNPQGAAKPASGGHSFPFWSLPAMVEAGHALLHSDPEALGVAAGLGIGGYGVEKGLGSVLKSDWYRRAALSTGANASPGLRNLLLPGATGLASELQP